jgi:hypothetical protein
MGNLVSWQLKTADFQSRVPSNVSVEIQQQDVSMFCNENKAILALLNTINTKLDTIGEKMAEDRNALDAAVAAVTQDAATNHAATVQLATDVVKFTTDVTALLAQIAAAAPDFTDEINALNAAGASLQADATSLGASDASVQSGDTAVDADETPATPPAS